MGVKMTGRVTARAYAKRDPHSCSSGPIILAKINSSSSDYPRPCLGHARITPRGPCHRRQYTILSYLKRWITDIWYSIMRRVKSMFSAQVDPDIPGTNSTRKIPSEMDSELENVFWREGIQKSFFAPKPFIGHWDRRYFGLGDNANVYSLYKVQRDSRTLSSDDSDLEKYTEKSEEHPAELHDDRHLPERIDSPLSFDEEYNALYEQKISPRPLSRPGCASSKDLEKCGTLVGGYIVSETECEKDDSCGRVSFGLDSSERFPQKPLNLRTKTKNPQDGEWVQNVCSGNSWHSGSELNNPVPNQNVAEDRTKKTSRIPRLCSQTRKTSSKNA